MWQITEGEKSRRLCLLYDVFSPALRERLTGPKQGPGESGPVQPGLKTSASVNKTCTADQGFGARAVVLERVTLRCVWFLGGEEKIGTIFRTDDSKMTIEDVVFGSAGADQIVPIEVGPWGGVEHVENRSRVKFYIYIYITIAMALSSKHESLARVASCIGDRGAIFEPARDSTRPKAP